MATFLAANLCGKTVRSAAPVPSVGTVCRSFGGLRCRNRAAFAMVAENAVFRFSILTQDLRRTTALVTFGWLGGWRTAFATSGIAFMTSCRGISGFHRYYWFPPDTTPSVVLFPGRCYTQSAVHAG